MAAKILIVPEEWAKPDANPSHRELKLDGAIGDFAEPLWRLKTGHFTT